MKKLTYSGNFYSGVFLVILLFIAIMFVGCSSSSKEVVTPTPVPVVKPATINFDSAVGLNNAVVLYAGATKLPSGGTLKVVCSNGKFATTNDISNPVVFSDGIVNNNNYTFKSVVIVNNVASDSSSAISAVPISDQTAVFAKAPNGMKLIQRNQYSNGLGSALRPYTLTSQEAGTVWNFAKDGKSFTYTYAGDTFGKFTCGWNDASEVSFNLGNTIGTLAVDVTSNTIVFEYKTTTTGTYWRDKYVRK